MPNVKQVCEIARFAQNLGLYVATDHQPGTPITFRFWLGLEERNWFEGRDLATMRGASNAMRYLEGYRDGFETCERIFNAREGS